MYSIQGDVKSYLRSHRTNHDTIDQQGLLLNIACDIASGLQAMHQNNFVHRFAWHRYLLTVVVDLFDNGTFVQFIVDLGTSVPYECTAVILSLECFDAVVWVTGRASVSATFRGTFMKAFVDPAKPAVISLGQVDQLNTVVTLVLCRGPLILCTASLASTAGYCSLCHGSCYIYRHLLQIIPASRFLGFYHRRLLRFYSQIL